MELARHETIGPALDEIQPPRQNSAARQPGRRSATKHCNCGTCATCQENARWERVFNEKFADPEYYLPRIIKRGSPLSG